jgi:superoxide dismutase, Cu-Zn family
MNRLIAAGSLLVGLHAIPAFAEETVTMNLIDANGVGEEIGTVVLEETAEGLVLTPDLRDLPEGERGFHVHENASCEPGERDGERQAGLAAGGHYDPQGTGTHAGPQADGGHLGDLPVLIVAADGTATQPVTAPRLTLEDVRGRSLMIHAGGDNYSDQPEPLGGGGSRIACGIVG